MPVQCWSTNKWRKYIFLCFLIKLGKLHVIYSEILQISILNNCSGDIGLIKFNSKFHIYNTLTFVSFIRRSLLQKFYFFCSYISPIVLVAPTQRKNNKWLIWYFWLPNIHRHTKVFTNGIEDFGGLRASKNSCCSFIRPAALRRLCFKALKY